MRDVLDKHSSTIQTANLQRARQYDDELQHLNERSPPDAPSWSCIAQEDTELDIYYNYNTKDRTGEEEAEELVKKKKLRVERMKKAKKLKMENWKMEKWSMKHLMIVFRNGRLDFIIYLLFIYTVKLFIYY